MGETETKTTKKRGRFARSLSSGGNASALCAQSRASEQNAERESTRISTFYPFFSGFHAYKKRAKKKRKFLTRARSESSRNDARANTETPGKRLVRANVDENYPFLSFFSVAF
jgi:hypothetical protein